MIGLGYFNWIAAGHVLLGFLIGFFTGGGAMLYFMVRGGAISRHVDRLRAGRK